jgi:hypothetical protein
VTFSLGSAAALSAPAHLTSMRNRVKWLLVRAALAFSACHSTRCTNSGRCGCSSTGLQLHRPMVMLLDLQG